MAHSLTLSSLSLNDSCLGSTLDFIEPSVSLYNVVKPRPLVTQISKDFKGFDGA